MTTLTRMNREKAEKFGLEAMERTKVAVSSQVIKEEVSNQYGLN